MQIKLENIEREEIHEITIRGFVQLTHELLRDNNDNIIAWFNGNYWILTKDDSQWTDIIIFSLEES